MTFVDRLREADVPVGRRNVLRSLGAFGLFGDLPGPKSLGSTLRSMAPATPDHGWIALQSSTAGLPLLDSQEADEFTDTSFYGSVVASNHALDYKGAQWVEFGDPGDGVGGCWKHTFALAGLTLAVRDKDATSDTIYPDAGAFETAQFLVETSNENLAIAEHRDRDLTGFLNISKVDRLFHTDVEVDGQTMGVAELVREAAAAGDHWLWNRLSQTDDDPTERAQKNDAIADASIGVVALAFGLLAGGLLTGGLSLLVAVAVPVLSSLLSDPKYDPGPVDFTDGIAATYDAHPNAPGGGQYVTFDVFVAPGEENAQFTVESNHDVRVFDMPFDENPQFFRRQLGFEPRPTWVVELDGEVHPDEMDPDDDPHNARVRLKQGGGDWMRDGRNPPVAAFEVTASPPTTATGLPLDASASKGLDADITDYEWKLRASRVDDTPQPISGGDGVREATGVAPTFNVFPGNYLVELTVRDANDLESTISQVVSVTRPPTVSLSMTPSNPSFGDEVTFTADASDPDDDPLTAIWGAYESGDSSPGPTPRSGGDPWPSLNGDGMQRTLDVVDPGATVTVSVTVADHHGATASDEVTFTVPDRTNGNGSGGGGGNAGGGNGSGNAGGTRGSGGASTSGGSGGRGSGGRGSGHARGPPSQGNASTAGGRPTQSTTTTSTEPTTQKPTDTTPTTTSSTTQTSTTSTTSRPTAETSTATESTETGSAGSRSAVGSGGSGSSGSSGSTAPTASSTTGSTRQTTTTSTASTTTRGRDRSLFSWFSSDDSGETNDGGGGFFDLSSWVGRRDERDSGGGELFDLSSWIGGGDDGDSDGGLFGWF